MPSPKRDHVPDLNARYWRLPAVIAYTQRSRSAVYADTSFPKPIKLAVNTAAWRVTEVIKWCEEQEERNASQPIASTTLKRGQHESE